MPTIGSVWTHRTSDQECVVIEIGDGRVHINSFDPASGRDAPIEMAEFLLMWRPSAGERHRDQHSGERPTQPLHPRSAAASLAVPHARRRARRRQRRSFDWPVPSAPRWRSVGPAGASRRHRRRPS